MTEPETTETPRNDPHEMVAETETGARNPTGAISKNILFYVPLSWTLFQLWYASPLPFIFNFGVFNSTEARAIHLAFAIFLSFTAYPHPLKNHRATTFRFRTGSSRWWGLPVRRTCGSSMPSCPTDLATRPSWI